MGFPAGLPAPTLARILACSNCGEDCATPLPGAVVATRKECKFGAALFADVVGSTTMAEREDPDVVQAVINRAFDRLSQEV